MKKKRKLEKSTSDEQEHSLKPSSLISLVRYSGPFLKWPREKLRQINRRTRKLMTMHKALRPRDDIERLYVSRKEGGRRYASIQDSVDVSIRELDDYIKKSKERLIKTTSNSTDNIGTNRKTRKTWKEKWEEKQLYGDFKRQIGEISRKKTWKWLRKGNLKREIEPFVIAAQKMNKKKL